MRNWRVRSYSGSGASCSRRMPERTIRRHSTYIESMLRRAAVRSAAWSGAPQIVHHVRMSSGEGMVRACSIREHLDSCHPAVSATCLAVSSASLRISLNLAASASSACCAVAERTGIEGSPRLRGPVVLVRDATVPGCLERRSAQLDDGGLVAQFGACCRAVAAEVVEQDSSPVEQPEVVPGQCQV